MFVERLSHSGVKIYTSRTYEDLRRAGRLSSETLDAVASLVVPGVSTGELDRFIHRFIVGHGARPATLGYKGYPKSSCISINHEVCHGIPRDDRILVDGDIVNIDVTVILNGWYGDTSRMYAVGSPSIKAQRLMDVTAECLRRGIAAARPGNTLGDIGYAIQSFAEHHRMGVVREFAGHGIGKVFHDAPSVFHHGRPGEGMILEPGMVFTIEPMINVGRPDVKTLSDHWTIVTRDRSLSAQYEHMIGVTEDAVEIFTLSAGAVAFENPLDLASYRYDPPAVRATVGAMEKV